MVKYVSNHEEHGAAIFMERLWAHLKSPSTLNLTLAGMPYITVVKKYILLSLTGLF